MPPQTEAMAQLMKRGGLEHRRSQLRGHQHANLGLQPPLTLPTGRHHVQQAASIARPPATRQPPQRRTTALNAQMSPIRLCHPPNRHEL